MTSLHAHSSEFTVGSTVNFLYVHYSEWYQVKSSKLSFMRTVQNITSSSIASMLVLQTMNRGSAVSKLSFTLIVLTSQNVTGGGAVTVLRGIEKTALSSSPVTK